MQKSIKPEVSLSHQISTEVWGTSRLGRIKALINQLYQANSCEYIDRLDFPVSEKIKVMNGLYLKNTFFGTYRKIFNYLRPLIQQVNDHEKRPFRILEIAGGTGDLSINLYQQADRDRDKLKLSITGSDIVDDYIKIARKKAILKNFPVVFENINALQLPDANLHRYDIVITLHSLHHFAPEQLIKIIQASQKLAKQGLFAVDGTRSIGNLLFMVLSSAVPSIMTCNSVFLHDAVISARKMYSKRFLACLAKHAAPQAFIEAKRLSLGLNYLRVSNRSNYF